MRCWQPQSYYGTSYVNECVRRSGYCNGGIGRSPHLLKWKSRHWDLHRCKPTASSLKRLIGVIVPRLDPGVLGMKVHRKFGFDDSGIYHWSSFISTIGSSPIYTSSYTGFNLVSGSAKGWRRDVLIAVFQLGGPGDIERSYANPFWDSSVNTATAAISSKQILLGILSARPLTSCSQTQALTLKWTCYRGMEDNNIIVCLSHIFAFQPS